MKPVTMGAVAGPMVIMAEPMARVRPQAPMGHAVDDDVHHERNEYARADRLYEPRHQKQREVRRQKAARRARNAHKLAAAKNSVRIDRRRYR